MTAASDLSALSIAALGAAFRARQLSPLDVTEHCLAQIARLDPEIHAFITVTGELAREQARAAADELARGVDRGPLHGVPIALKDLIDTAGVRTTAASATYEDRVPTEDAEVVRRLRNAGAVIVGKLNLHEFAYGGSGVIGHYPITRNPRNPAHITGGSSSGSAAAVASGMCYAALGSDTAGSIRLPAALCGIVGLKPSYGLVPLRGVIPLSWSLDHIGPMTRSVRDAALVLQAIAGHDVRDFTSRALPVPDYAAALDDDRPRPRVGVARAHFFADLDPEIAAAIDRALGVLAGLAAELRDVDLPIDDDRTVFRAEAWAYHRGRIESMPDRYQAETLRRLRTCEGVSSADYIAKSHELELLRRGSAAMLGDVDLIVTPTSPIAAPTFAELPALTAPPDSLRLRELVLLRNTRPFDIWGMPAISVPCGTTQAGLPIGLQIGGRIGAEADVLRLAAAYERQAAIAR